MYAVNFKSESANYFTSKGWVYLEIAESCNPGQGSYRKTIGESGEQIRGILFYREKGDLEGLL